MKHLLTTYAIIVALTASLVAFSFAVSYQFKVINDQRNMLMRIEQEIEGLEQTVRTLEETSEQLVPTKEPIQPWDARDWNQELIEFLPLEETIRSSFEGAVIHDYLARDGIQVEHNRYWQSVHLSAVHYMETLD